MERVAIIGSGNWGSAISKIIALNTQCHPRLFHPTVSLWVFEETLPDGRLLSQVISEERENVKYLPNVKLPDNLRVLTDLGAAVSGCTILVFVLPHQFVKKTCAALEPIIAEEKRCGRKVRAISLIKGIHAGEDGLQRVSQMICEMLQISVSVLMGANIADEVAVGRFCEATIGVSHPADAALFTKLFSRSHFQIRCTADVAGVELCGALKNVVAFAAGIVDGMGLGSNTKAAVMRIGLNEMRRFCRLLDDTVKEETFLESCGVADLITTCYGGRNRRIGEALAKTGRDIDSLEKEMLNGQKLQGPQVSYHAFRTLQEHQLTTQYPLFISVYMICYEGADVSVLFENLQEHYQEL